MLKPKYILMKDGKYIYDVTKLTAILTEDIRSAKMYSDFREAREEAKKHFCTLHRLKTEEI